MSKASKAAKQAALAALANGVTIGAEVNQPTHSAIVALINDTASTDTASTDTASTDTVPALDVFGMTDQQCASEMQALAATPAPALKRTTQSCKAWLRELLSVDGAQYSLKQLIALTGKTEVNVRTMLSDLRSVKYAGKAGVFNTKSVRVNGVLLYSKAD